MKKCSTTMKEKIIFNLFLSIICLLLIFSILKDCAKSRSEPGFWDLFLILIPALMSHVLSLQGLSYIKERKSIYYLRLILSNEYIPFQPKNKLPKDFEEFKKKFKRTNFLDFYTAEVRMDDFEYIHVRFKDKYDNITDKKVISATNFCRYFQVIE